MLRRGSRKTCGEAAIGQAAWELLHVGDVRGTACVGEQDAALQQLRQPLRWYCYAAARISHRWYQAGASCTAAGFHL